MEPDLYTKVNFYELLGIDRQADTAEVKKAYRTLVKKYHPDLNKDPQAPQAFRTIQSAYEVLSDPYKRKIYDYLLYRKEMGMVNQETANQYTARYRRRPHTRHAAQAAAYARQARDEPETIPELIIFHIKQLIGLLISMILLGVGISMVGFGMYFFFVKDFNGSTVAGYFATAIGLAILYGITRAFRVLISIWSHWFEKRKEQQQKKQNNT